MKMNKQTFAKLEQAINETIKDRTIGTTIEAIIDLYKKGDLSPERFRWDLLHCAANSGAIDYHSLYIGGLNDNHIDTALRAITKTSKNW